MNLNKRSIFDKLLNWLKYNISPCIFRFDISFLKQVFLKYSQIQKKWKFWRFQMHFKPLFTLLLLCWGWSLKIRISLPVIISNSSKYKSGCRSPKHSRYPRWGKLSTSQTGLDMHIRHEVRQKGGSTSSTNENFRGKTTVCERITGAAYKITDTTTVHQSREERVLEKLRGESVQLLGLLATAKPKHAKVSHIFPFKCCTYSQQKG